MKIIIWIISIVMLAGCTVSYSVSDVMSGTNKNLPKIFDLKLAKLNTYKLESVFLNEKDQRMYFSFKSKLENPLSDIECSSFKVSAKPVLKNGVVVMTEGKADEIKCGGIPVTDLVNYIKDTFFSQLEIETVKLEGMKKALAKKIYIEGNEIKVSWGIF